MFHPHPGNIEPYIEILLHSDELLKSLHYKGFVLHYFAKSQPTEFLYAKHIRGEPIL